MAELDVAFKVFADLKDTVDHIDKRMHRSQPKPIRRPVGTNVVQSAAAPSPILLKIQDTPAVGRMWFVKKIALFGTDGHTAVTNPGVAPAVNQIPLGATGVATYNNNSFGVNQTITGGTVTAIAINGTTTGLTSGVFFVPAGGTVTVTYSVAPTTFTTAFAGTVAAVPVSVDIYAGAEFDLGGGNPLSDFSSQLVPGAAIPSVTRYGRFDQPVSAHEYIYAWAYTIPANQSVSLVCEVDDWRVDEQEAMSV